MIPNVDDLKSDILKHKSGDIFNPPGLTNFWGCVQSDIDLTGVRSLNFPPFGCSDIITGGLFIDDKYFPATGTYVDFVWYPDRIERSAEYKGIFYKSVTVLPMKKKAVLVHLEMENRSGEEREVEIRFGFAGSVTKAVRTWNDAFPPLERDNKIEIDNKRKALLYSAKHSTAFQLQGIYSLADEINTNGVKSKIKLKAAEKKNIIYINAVDDAVEDLQNTYDEITNNSKDIIKNVHDEWNEEIKADEQINNETTGAFFNFDKSEYDTSNIEQIYRESTLNVSVRYPYGWTYIDQNVKNKLDGVTFWSVHGNYEIPP